MELENMIREVDMDDFYEEMGEIKMKDSNRVIKTDAILKKFKILFVKNLAVMIGTAACAYFKLMHPILYVPIEIFCLCSICFKYGEWKGRIDGE